MSKLDYEDELVEIYALHCRGLSADYIAKEMGRSHDYVVARIREVDPYFFESEFLTDGEVMDIESQIELSMGRGK